jgi:hypothetical protein
VRLLTVILFLIAAVAVPVSAADEIPFTFTNGFIWVEVTASKSNAKLNFLFDSGAAASTLSAAAAEQLNLRDGKAVTVRGVSGTTRGRWPQRLDARAGGVKLPQKFLVVNLCDLEKTCQCPVAGLIGADFFEGRRVQIDFRAKRIRLLDLPVAAANGTSVPLKQRRGIWRVPIHVNGGREEWVRLDTGCAIGLHWVNSVASENTSEAKLSVALTEFATPTTRTSVRLASRTFANVPTALHGKPIFSGEQGLLGNELLSRFARVTIDTRAGLLTLE